MLERSDLQLIFNLIKPNSRVLDLGCGDGQLLNELVNKKRINGLGIEISLEKIKKCLECGISVVQEDLNEGLKDFKNRSFDYVILSQTFEDITNPVYLIREMIRVGKKCIISFENLAYWKNRIMFLLKGNLKREGIDNYFLCNGKKKQILTVKKFLRFSSHYRLKINKSIYLPNNSFSLNNILPNLFSKVAIFILENSDLNYLI